MTEVFEDDRQHTIRSTHAIWERLLLKEKRVEKFIRPLRSQL